MTYMDNPSTSRRPVHRPIARRPVDPRPVDDDIREEIIDAAARLPNFTAAELVAELEHLGVPVDTDTVRFVLEQ